ncbi:MAG: 30S ribosomal protein S6 [Planctomycetes bacterium]|nr:30S ribosomal protein S6 [Planctomycetota bacterium]
METVVGKKLYEGMFLVDSAQASDWDATIATLEKVLERADAEDVSMRKWDERRLAYEINGKSRGTYILCYFKADGEKIQEIEKAVQLSERIMRVLILSTEQMTAEHIDKDTPATRVEKEAAAKEAAQAAEAEQESSEQEPAEAGEVETKEEAGQTKQAGRTEETAEADTGKVESAGEAEESKEPEEPEPGDATEASAETESEQTEEENR